MNKELDPIFRENRKYSFYKARYVTVAKHKRLWHSRAELALDVVVYCGSFATLDEARRAGVTAIDESMKPFEEMARKSALVNGVEELLKDLTGVIGSDETSLDEAAERIRDEAYRLALEDVLERARKQAQVEALRGIA